MGERLRGRMVGKAGKRKAKILGVKKKAVENNLRVGLHPVKYKHCSKKQTTESFRSIKKLATMIQVKQGLDYTNC